ncbi:MAG: CPBP family intramembrane glutamic endopeptidase [Candidatus Thorarchaeota archaeon]
MSSEESFLSQRIWIAFIILESCWITLGFLIRYTSDILATDWFLDFVLRFLFRGILLLLVVPLLLKIPNGERSYTEFLGDIKLTRYKPFVRNLIITVVSTLLLLSGLFLTGMLYGNYTVDLGFLLLPENAVYVFGAINAGVWEEIMWRGIILTLFLKRYSVRTSITLNTVLFALSHLQNLLVGRPLVEMLGQLIFVLIATPFIAYVFIKTESLIPGIIIHYAIDTLGHIFMISMIQPGPNLIIGGIYMLVGWFIGNILAFAFLKVYVKEESQSIGDSIEN